MDYAHAIEPYSLFWFKEIGDPLDYQPNATLCEHYTGPIATGETCSRCPTPTT